MTTDAASVGKPAGLERKWKVLIAVMFGIFMVILDSTIVNIAFPTLRSEFGATASGPSSAGASARFSADRHSMSPRQAPPGAT